MKYKLVCFDIDGTLIDNVAYSWQIFHDYFKINPKLRDKYRKLFYKGKISYEEWALYDINLWREKKAKKQDFIQAISNLKLMKGARETLKTLKDKGYKLAIISGSINIIIEHLLPEYEEIFDDIFVNKLFFDKEGNIIDVQVTSYDIEHKTIALKRIAEREKINLKQTVFVGDHLNDIEIMKEAGFSIAFDPKDPELKKVADIVIEQKDLRQILKHL